MIKYKLVCNKCKNTFDSWFASSKEFEKLKKQNFLSCINCNSKKVDKSLMAPLIMKKSKRSAKKDEKNKHIKNKLKEWQSDPDSDDTYVFGKDGKWMVYETFRRNFVKIKDRSNVKYHGGVHSFRHYFASFLIDAKVHSHLEIAQFIGHEDPGFTLKRYAKCFNDHDKWLNGIDKIDTILGGC